ncbi:NrtR DNA-binding winged helix domain-containing protein [Parvularcula sp. LCG005]|uniref:NUDIX hydrolase n=1 Tax=Parvularcula sp. LCG005 TaxID=3078805 RepID=UPI002941BC91|nr:hypothetical protein [Parvularcula sp. LCG005]WOI52782.1 hypothetical protein RUI03_11555 [Parvularcula sp. LCG005]
MEQRLLIGLNAVLAAISADGPKVLCVERKGGWGLPFGQFDPSRHRTFEIGLRDFVKRQASLPLGYVEQLYTFGDMGRESPRPSMANSDPSDRIVSIGYLGLSPEMAVSTREKTAWRDWYDYFPWEDWRAGAPPALSEIMTPLRQWANTPERYGRLKASFGLDDILWEEERVLERYELMYEAGLVEEAVRDNKLSSTVTLPAGSGQTMISDHRRILATAISRLRGKLRYRPIIFQMMPELFTLTALQASVESVLGFEVHKQNFRRSLETAKLVQKTENIADTGGRPAALYRASRLASERFAPGLTLPRLREDKLPY